MKADKLKVFQQEAEEFCRGVLAGRVLTLHAGMAVPVGQLVTASELYKNLLAADARCMAFYDVKCAKLVPYRAYESVYRAEPKLDADHFEAFIKTATELNVASRDFLVIYGGRFSSNEGAIRKELG